MRVWRQQMWIGVGLVLAGAGCGLIVDDAGRDPSPPVSAAPSGARMPAAPHQTAGLDPATRRRCDEVWSIGVFVYSAHQAADPPPAERDRIAAGIADHETRAAELVPELADDVRSLAAYARQALDPRSKVRITPELAAANKRLNAYLSATCGHRAG